MVLLDHYIHLFPKRLDILINVIKIIQQCLLQLKIYIFLKNTMKYGKKIEKLMKIDFSTKTTYGDDDKYIKTKIKT